MKKLFYISCMIIMCGVYSTSAQYINVDELVNKSLQQHPSLQQFLITQQQIEAKKKMSIYLPDMEFLFQSPNGENMRLGVMQTIPFPGQWIAHRKMINAEIETHNALNAQYKLMVENQVRKYHLQAMFYQESLRHYKEIDSLYQSIVTLADNAFKSGKISEFQLSQVQFKKDKTAMTVSEYQLLLDYQAEVLGFLVGNGAKIYPKETFDYTNENDSLIEGFNNYPLLKYYSSLKIQQKKNINYTKTLWAPSFIVGYLNQADNNTDLYHRLSFGFTLPVWFWTKSAQVKQAKYQFKQAEFGEKKNIWQMNLYQMQLNNQQTLLNNKIKYYESKLIPFAEKSQQVILLKYQSGQISYFEMLYQIEQYFQSQLEYLNILYQKRNNDIDRAFPIQSVNDF